MSGAEPRELEPYELIVRARVVRLDTDPPIVLVLAVGGETLTITTQSLRTIGDVEVGNDVALIALPGGELVVRALLSTGASE